MPKLPKLGGGCCNKTDCCQQPCCEQPCCEGDPCEIAKLIYISQTACYADDREDAIDELGDYDACKCHPAIMVAFLYALNDADEEVRAEAADEIGDQIKERCCCCTPEIIAALTCALGDCDSNVVGQAEEALEACGYEIVDGCCNTCCNTCNTCGTASVQGTPVQGAPVESAPYVAPQAAPQQIAPTPAPPEEPKAYFPSRTKKKNSLAGLFGLLN